jgi:hypothetical protein
MFDQTLYKRVKQLRKILKCSECVKVTAQHEVSKTIHSNRYSKSSRFCQQYVLFLRLLWNCRISGRTTDKEMVFCAVFFLC